MSKSNSVSNTLNSAIEHFNNSTIETNMFQVEDVINDNACFYRSFANILNYMTPNKSLHDIKDLKHFGKLKSLENMYQNPDWGYYSENQERLARYLQGKSYRWIKNHYTEQIDEYGMDLGTMVYLTHEIDIDEYIDRYKYFAGDLVVDTFEVQNKKDANKVDIKEYEIEERWGGMPEQVALSEAYKIPIVILTSQKYSTRYNKIVTGKIRLNKPENNVRFKVLQIYGKKFLKDKLPIFLLWKKKDRLGHYMALYPKNAKVIDNLKNFL